MLFTDKWMIIIPRSKARAFDHILINSIGMMGRLTFLEEKEIEEKVKKLGLNKVYLDVCYPLTYQQD